MLKKIGAYIWQTMVVGFIGIFTLIIILNRGGLTDIIDHPVGGKNTFDDYLALSIMYILIGSITFLLFRFQRAKKIYKILSAVIVDIFYVINLFFLAFGSPYNWSNKNLLPHILLGVFTSIAVIGYSVYSCIHSRKTEQIS
jgi:hypothetical protein